MFILFLSTLHAAESKSLVVVTKARSIYDAHVELLVKDSRHRVKPASGVIDPVDRERARIFSAVPVGSRVSSPNIDNIQHPIDSFSNTRSFALPLFNQTERSLYQKNAQRCLLFQADPPADWNGIFRFRSK